MEKRRLVKLLWNEMSKSYIESIYVRIERNSAVAHLISRTDALVGSTEYSDGSWLDVYFVAGEFIGLEYDDGCNLITE